MTDTRLLAVELLAVADALRSVAQRIDRLHRADRIDGTEVVVIYCNTPSMVEALESLAQKLGVSEESLQGERQDAKPPAWG